METIFKKIYPQKDGIPVFNQKGLYWVKLYHMGKPRKIVIDDTVPCSRTGEILLPITENSEEIWPAILTKALLKLFSYKFKSYIYQEQEIGDLHVIYALTGYFPEQVNFDKLLLGSENSDKKNAKTNAKENNNNNNKRNNKINHDENKFVEIQEILKSKLSYYISDECFFFKKHFVLIYNNTPLADLFNLEKPLYHDSPNKNRVGNTNKILLQEANTNNQNRKICRTNTPKCLSNKFFRKIFKLLNFFSSFILNFFFNHSIIKRNKNKNRNRNIIQQKIYPKKLTLLLNLISNRIFIY